MSVTNGQEVTGFSAGSTSSLVTGTPARPWAAGAPLVLTSRGVGADLTSVTGGNVTTWIKKTSQNSASFYAQIWYGYSAGGSEAVTANCSSASGFAINVLECPGAPTSGDPFEAFNGANGINGTSLNSGSVTPAAGTDVLLIECADFQATTSTDPSGWTPLSGGGATTTTPACYRVITGASGSYSAAYAIGYNRYAIVIGAILSRPVTDPVATGTGAITAAGSGTAKVSVKATGTGAITSSGSGTATRANSTPTRFYLSSTAAAPVSPAFTGAWTRTTEGDRGGMSVVKEGSAMASKTAWANTSPAANASALFRQYVSARMAAGITFVTGDTIKAVIRCMESATNDNINRTPIGVYVFSSDGATLRATLKTLGAYGPNTTEWNTSLRSKQLTNSTALTNGYTTVAGDRLVIEVGGQVDATGGTTVTGSMSFGSDNASDLAENETGTTALNPWFEISRAITFLPSLATGTGAIATSGSGTAKVSAKVTGTGAISKSGSGTAKVTAKATGTGAIATTGSGTAVVTAGGRTATGTGAIASSGVGAATVAVRASGTAAIVPTGSGSATAAVRASGSGAIASNGAGAAKVEAKASGTAAILASGSGTAKTTSSGSGTGAIALAGFGAAAVAVLGVGSGSIAVSGSGTAGVSLAVAGSGAIGAAGSGLALVAVTATGSGSIAVSGAGLASIGRAAAGTGAIDVAGSGTALVSIDAAGTGTIPLSGAGASSVAVAAIGTGTVAVSGSGLAFVGYVPVIASGSGAVPVASSGVGLVAVFAAGGGVLTVAGSGQASVGRRATGIGAIPVSGAGVARVAVFAAGGGSIVLSGSGTAYGQREAFGSGSITIAGSGTGRVAVFAEGSATIGVTGAGAVAVGGDAPGGRAFRYVLGTSPHLLVFLDTTPLYGAALDRRPAHIVQLGGTT